MNSDILSAIAAVAANIEPETVCGIAAQFNDEEPIFISADTVFPTASVIKIAIVAELYTQAAHGRLSLDTPVVVRAEDTAGGSGVLSLLTPGLSLPLRDLAALTIAVSDNTASNLCLAAVGGKNVVNTRMRDVWGMESTVIHRPIQFELTPADPPHTATGTPRDFLRLLTLLRDGEVHDAAVSAAVLKIMETTQDATMIPRHLAVNPYAKELNSAAPPFTIAHKTGGVTGVRHDVGIVRRGGDTLMLAIFTKNSQDPRWTAENKGVRIVAEIAKILTDTFFHPKAG